MYHRHTAIICLFAATVALGACVPEQGDDTTETFRAGLVSQADLDVEYEPVESTQSMMMWNDDEGSGVSQLAVGTGRAVIGTNAFLLELVTTMELIVAHPPTVAQQDYHVWEGPDGDDFFRVTIEQSDHPQGDQFDFALEAGSVEDDDDELETLFDGYSVRPDEYEPGDRRGWGIVEHDFDAIDAFEPDKEIGGSSAIAFRHLGGVHQVEVRLDEVVSDEHEDFVPGAAYSYVNFEDGSGTLDWLAQDDFTGEGEPYETVAAHVQWDSDHTGVGAGLVTDGDLDVDYLQVGECWASSLEKSYARITSPDGELNSGDKASCGETTPADLSVPDEADFDGELEVPAEHPDEA